MPGCVGGVNGFANTNGQALCDLVALFQSGQLQKASELQRKIIRPNGMVSANFRIGFIFADLMLSLDKR